MVETMIESQSMTERAIGELTEFNEMIQVVIPYGQLTVAEDGIGKVEEAHKAVKRLSASIEKKRKELKAGALEYGRTVDSIAKQLSEKVDGIEVKLKAEREAFDAIEKAEKAAKEAEKQAAKQARLNAMVAAGIPVDLVAADLPQEEWMWWLSKATKEAEARQAAELMRQKTATRIARMEALGVAIGSEERVASLCDEQFEFDYNVAKKTVEDRKAAEEAERQRQSEELRVRAEEMERQRLQDEQRMQAERRQLAAEREEMEAKLAEQRKAAEAEREELRRQQEEIRKAEQAKIKEQQAEERKRREDAAKPELERLDNRLEAIRIDCKNQFNPMPWWAPEFLMQFESFADSIKSFVREGENA